MRTRLIFDRYRWQYTVRQTKSGDFNVQVRGPAIPSVSQRLFGGFGHLGFLLGMSRTMQEHEGGSSEADCAESCNEYPRSYAYHSERIILSVYRRLVYSFLYFSFSVLSLRSVEI